MDTKMIIAGAFLAALILSTCLGKIVIPALKKLHFGQEIREEGPKEHQSKSGTPTMGGVIFLVPILIVTIVASFILGNFDSIPVLLVALGFGVVGLIDDYIKVVKKRNLGLTEIQKSALQAVIAIAFLIYVLNKPEIGTGVIIPFTSGKIVTMPVWLYIPFFLFVILGTVNGANLTDGLDGLCSSVTVVIAAFFMFVGVEAGISPVAAAFAGALIGFLIYNVFPAQVFMGDTGSLAIGGFVAAAAIALKMPIFLLLIGFIYLVEVISDILQVAYFKYTKKKYGEGRRIFRMAPLHHHYQSGGCSEPRIVTSFSTVTLCLCIIAYFAL